MEFSWSAFWVTILWKAAEGAVSWREKTFSFGQMMTFSMGHTPVPLKFRGHYRWQHLPMSFLNNWVASWGDLIVWSLFNWLVIPYTWLILGPVWKALMFLFIGFGVSYFFHRAWWGHDENLGHVFKKWEVFDKDFFMADLTKAGWVHFWFMAAQVAVVLAYVFTPMPREIIWWVTILLSVFVIIQNIQAVVIQKGYEVKFLFIALVELLAIWVIALLKII